MKQNVNLKDQKGISIFILTRHRWMWLSSIWRNLHASDRRHRKYNQYNQGKDIWERKRDR